MEERTDVVSTLVSLLERRITFAMYSLPGSDYHEFIIDDNVSPVASRRKFTVAKWNGEKIEIHDRVNPSDIRGLKIRDFQLPESRHAGVPTSWADYKSGIEKVVNILSHSEGKVVISKQDIISDERIDFTLISECVPDMFQRYESAFCAVYYTPATGAWCVCSPELLLSVNKKSGELRTVALAGTREIEEKGPWDKKNIKEHAYVVDYISDTLKSANVEPHINEMESMPAGSICHLLTKISGEIDTADVDSMICRIIERLHPTPAICGYPVEWSRCIIDSVERHDRECYGGFYSVEDENLFIAHVNLRCFEFDNGMCRFLAGGGILADSSPESEWAEATSKINVTKSFITNALK